MEINNIIEQKIYENDVFPLTYHIINNDDRSNSNNNLDKIIDWFSSNNKIIDDHLLKHKAILFRLVNLYILYLYTDKLTFKYQ